MVKISFIIPSYNSWRTIDQTIQSILKQNQLDAIVDIVVVDSSDDQKSRAVIQSIKHEKLKTIFLERKTIPAIARNEGVKVSSGEVLCFIDSDVYLAPDWTDRVLEVWHKGCRAGCGSVSIPEKQKHNLLALAQLYLQFNESLNVGSRRLKQFLPGCNIFCDRTLFQKVGGFPEIRAAEDVLFCLEVNRYTPTWFVPLARCFHIFREDLRAYLNNQILLGRYIIKYRKHYYKEWYYRGILPILLLPVFLMIKLFRMVFRISKAGAGHFVNFLLSSPLFLLGLWYWAVGFYRGSREKGLGDE